VRHPELFRAAVIDVGYANMPRFEQMPTGPSNRHEFGSVEVESEYRALREVDAVHGVHKGIPYPNVLLTTGFNDPRVASWHSAKMVTALQDAGADAILRVRFDSGHGVGATRNEEIERTADWYAFMWHFLTNTVTIQR
jgi:prolyl oligopeptidase